MLGAIERQQGILVERATDIYSFSHLTLQEYLTAFHIVDARLEAEVIEQHLTDERWREVFLLMAGLSGNRAIDLLQGLYNQSQSYRQDCPKLDRLLRWASDSTAGAQGSYSPLAKRAAALEIAKAISSTLYNSPFALSVAITNSSTITSAIANSSAIAKSIAIARSLRIESTIGINSHVPQTFLESTIGVNSNMSQTLLIKGSITRASVVADRFAYIFGRAKYANLPGHLRRLLGEAPDDPDDEDAPDAWRAWADELEASWLDALGLDRADLPFNSEEAKALHDYLYATELLIRCKEAAVRIPKQAWAELEARLLTM